MYETKSRTISYQLQGTIRRQTIGIQAPFPPAIVGTVAVETNRKAKRAHQKNLRSRSPKPMPPWKNIDVDELYAYIAILLYSAAEKSNSIRAKDFFDKTNKPFYRAVMLLERFEQVTRFLRFDNS